MNFCPSPALTPHFTLTSSDGVKFQKDWGGQSLWPWQLSP